MFGYLLSTKTPEMTITVQWAYDIIQEFVYHFQDFCQFRAQVGQRSEEEILTLKQNKASNQFPYIMNLFDIFIFYII